MDLFEAIRGRQSIRRFKPAPVQDEDIRKILDAGRWAPSANNTQPWGFIVIRDKALLAKMAGAVRDMVDRMIPYAEGGKQAQRLAAYKGTYYTFFEHAPVLIAVCMDPYDTGTDQLLARMGYPPEQIRRLRPLPGLQSVAAAVQNMLLAIHALGYGSCWMTGPLVAQEEFSELLDLEGGRVVATLLPVGIPDEGGGARSRKELDQMTRFIPPG